MIFINLFQKRITDRMESDFLEMEFYFLRILSIFISHSLEWIVIPILRCKKFPEILCDDTKIFFLLNILSCPKITIMFLIFVVQEKSVLILFCLNIPDQIFINYHLFNGFGILFGILIFFFQDIFIVFYLFFFHIWFLWILWIFRLFGVITHSNVRFSSSQPFIT